MEDLNSYVRVEGGQAGAAGFFAFFCHLGSVFGVYLNEHSFTSLERFVSSIPNFTTNFKARRTCRWENYFIRRRAAYAIHAFHAAACLELINNGGQS